MRPAELVALDQLVEVGGHHLKYNASVRPEDKGGLHVNHVPSSVKILGPKVPQNLHLVLRLLFKIGSVPHHLDGDVLGVLVVESLEDLGERTFAQETDQLVPEKHFHLIPYPWIDREAPFLNVLFSYGQLCIAR